MQPSKAQTPMLARLAGRLVSARQAQLEKAQLSMLVRPSAGQHEGGTAPKGPVADVGEAVGQAGQDEGGAFVKGVGADAGDAIG